MARSQRPDVLVRDLLARELETVTLYVAMAARARTPAVRELLERIAREEKHHIGEAMDLLARLDSAQASALAERGLEVGTAAGAEPGETSIEGPAASRVRFEPDGRTVETGADETLLATALANGVDIRHDCGGRGRCGTCRVEVGDGALTPITDPERHHLGDLLASGWRLACQVRPLGPLTVTVPPNRKGAEA